MKHRVIFFTVLVFFRVFLVPAWFSWHIDNVKDPAETYEHIRLKKRRGSFLEENIYIYELAHSRATLFTPEQRTVFFTPEPGHTLLPVPDADGQSFLVFRPITLPLYLWNRMLRI